MPTARGFINCENDKLVGTFHFDGDLHHLSVDIRPPNQSFHCSNATLTYATAEKLLGPCTWMGRAGKTDLQMQLGDGVSIAARLDKPRMSPVLVRGAGAWTTDPEPEPEPSLEQPESPDERLAREKLLLASGAPIIVMLGQPGTGKSTFINLIASDQQKVNNNLQPCTCEISIVEAKVCGKRVVLIDTPGIDDFSPGAKESPALASIASRFAAMGRDGAWITGVLFMNCISDTKLSQTASRVSSVVKSLCGEAAMNHVIICATMWDKVTAEVGYERLEELCQTGAWREMVDMGAGTAQISSVGPDAKNNAESIVSELIDNAQPVELSIQVEMINQNKTVMQTGAGMVLSEHLRAERLRADRELEEVHMIMREIEVSEARAQEAMRVQVPAVKELEKKVDDLTRDRQEMYERLQQEKEEMERKARERDERMREERAAEIAKMEAAVCSHAAEVKELKGQMEAFVQQSQRHKEDQEQELKRAVQQLELLIAQVVVLPATPLHIFNKRFNKALYYYDNSTIYCHEPNSRTDYQWMFKREGGGHEIVTRYSSASLRLGQKPDGMLAMVEESCRVLWIVRPAGGQTFRIAKLDEPTLCIEQSTSDSDSPIGLKAYNAEAMGQLWEFVPVGSS